MLDAHHIALTVFLFLYAASWLQSGIFLALRETIEVRHPHPAGKQKWTDTGHKQTNNWCWVTRQNWTMHKTQHKKDAQFWVGLSFDRNEPPNLTVCLWTLRLYRSRCKNKKQKEEDEGDTIDSQHKYHFWFWAAEIHIPSLNFLHPKL